MSWPKGKSHSPEQKENMRQRFIKINLARKGIPLTEETRRKISISNKGRIRSPEARIKDSVGKMGSKNPMFGKFGKENFHWGRRRNMETRAKMSVNHKGHPISRGTRNKIRITHLGDKNPSWKGGITPEAKRIRNSIEFRLWREAVFARDNWICQKCRERGGRIHPHHIRAFSEYPELRTSIENGITICEKHHRQFHKIYGRKNNNVEQLEIFLNEIEEIV